MNSSELTVLISALAVTIADSVPDNDDLGLLSSVLVQLGDTLDTIATRREMTNGK